MNCFFYDILSIDQVSASDLPSQAIKKFEFLNFRWDRSPSLELSDLTSVSLSYKLDFPRLKKKSRISREGKNIFWQNQKRFNDFLSNFLCYIFSVDESVEIQVVTCSVLLTMFIVSHLSNGLQIEVFWKPSWPKYYLPNKILYSFVNT